MMKSLYTTLVKICRVKAIFNTYLLPLPLRYISCAHINCLISINIQQILMSAIFSAQKNSMIHLSFVYIFMSDAILSDCCPVDICQNKKKRVIGRKLQLPLLYHRYPTLMPWANIIK